VFSLLGRPILERNLEGFGCLKVLEAGKGNLKKRDANLNTEDYDFFETALNKMKWIAWQ